MTDDRHDDEPTDDPPEAPEPLAKRDLEIALQDLWNAGYLSGPVFGEVRRILGLEE